ncbi:glycosyl transferase family 4 [Candidatus Pacearchaeota archaeon CG10_big_fil_rev_8_21_14_0_10_31_24]|nr:MAG: glycosyl transferase family 4 [Candidatus Pacearchaeota archaeon CG10_big_fil_rev_8_21_14_0_10_31_24]
MKEYILLIPIIVSFLITLMVTPSWIRRAHNAGLVGKDMHKFKGNLVAEAGGINVVAGFIIGVLIYIALKTFYFEQSIDVLETFALISVIMMVSFIGLIDDLLGWKIGLGNKVRLGLVLFAAIPLIVINAGSSEVSLPFIGAINMGLLYPLLVIPIAVIGTSTTFNFLAGYNGLEARQGILILGALAFASWFTGSHWLSVILTCMIASLLAFLIFNSYPARVFPGDVLTYSIGALIASIAILGNLEKFALFIFIPNILEVFLKLKGKLKKESFALAQEDGSIKQRYNKIYGLEHLGIYIIGKFKKVYENDVILFVNLIQIIVIILAFIIFKEGIFL